MTSFNKLENPDTTSKDIQIVPPIQKQWCKNQKKENQIVEIRYVTYNNDIIKQEKLK